MHPSQDALIFSTSDGPKEIILDRSFVVDGFFTAFIVGSDGQGMLVELPAETSDGFWRVTVGSENIKTCSLAA